MTRDAALIVGANAVPLLGVVFAGWDAFTLLMLYWFETAVIGFWVCLAVITSRQDTLTIRVTREGTIRPGFGIGLFIAAHAGIFMLVHMFFLFGFREISGTRGSGPSDLLGLLLEGGLWLPLAALFLLRGLITVSDHFDGRPLESAIVGFYLRILIMQVAIVIGGFFAVFAGGSIIPLVLLIGLRTAIDLGIEPLAERISRLTARPELPAQGD